MASSCHTAPAVPLSAVEEQVETVVVLAKDPHTRHLGVTIVGGCDTYLGCVVVQGVTEGGAAWVDGRLRQGDILLQVNDTSLLNKTREDAVAALRECSSPVRLLVLREDPETLFTTTEATTKFITVEMRKSAVTERLGLSLMARRDGKGIFVTLVEPGSVAARCGTIMQGDKLLEVNGMPVDNLSLSTIAQQLRKVEVSVVMVFGRVPSLARAVHDWSRSKPSRANTPARLRIHTWSHSHSLTRSEDSDEMTEEDTGGGRALVQRLQSHVHAPRTRVGRLPRPPSLLHVLRRSFRGHTPSSTMTVVRTCTPDSAEALVQPSTPGSARYHVRFHTTEVISLEDNESCSSDQPFLSDVRVTSL